MGPSPRSIDLAACAVCSNAHSSHWSRFLHLVLRYEPSSFTTSLSSPRPPPHRPDLVQPVNSLISFRIAILSPWLLVCQAGQSHTLLSFYFSLENLSLHASKLHIGHRILILTSGTHKGHLQPCHYSSIAGLTSSPSCQAPWRSLNVRSTSTEPRSIERLFLQNCPSTISYRTRPCRYVDHAISRQRSISNSSSHVHSKISWTISFTFLTTPRTCNSGSG